MLRGSDQQSGLDTGAKIALIVIGVVAAFFALDRLESIFAPLVLAIVTGIVLSPVTDALERMGLPNTVGAFVNLILTLVLAAVLVLVFQPVVSQMIDQAPLVWAELRDTIRALRRMASELLRAADDMARTINAEGGDGGGDGEENPIPSVRDAIVLAPTILAQIFVFAGALFFFSSSRNEIYAWIAKRLAVAEERPRLARRLRRAERRVSRYFLTISIINAGLGIAAAALLQWIGLPNAIFWGTAAALLNFVLYLGPAITTFGLLFAGIASFQGAYSLLPAAAYLVLNMIEAQFVTPALVGRNMSINPLLVFLALLLGLWLWGPVGGIVAIPVLVWVLVVAEVADYAEPETPREAA